MGESSSLAGRASAARFDSRERKMEGFIIPWQPIVMAVALMVFDYFTGFAGAVKKKVVSSAKMREGLWHKAGFCGLMLLTIAYEVAALWVDFEMALRGLDVFVPDIPAVTAVCVYIMVTEVVSILENLCELNPAIAKLPFVAALRPHGDDVGAVAERIEKMADDEG